ncbi:MAG TPA: hypothetical protein VLG50_05400 [Candidatus Saccharimonadales bacterium]|nr:hypothetical protein [Candidatus Saccharimonadales bacterium]
MKSVLVLCHGRNDRIIKEIDYKSSIFINSDPATKPDYRMSIVSPQISKIGKFEHIINAFCPLFLEATDIIMDEEGMFVDGQLNKDFMNSIKTLIYENGYVYMYNLFDNSMDIFVDKMYFEGFQYIDDVIFTFNDTKITLSKFIYTGNPTKTKLLNYLNTIHLRILYIYMTCFADEFEEEVTIKINPSNHIHFDIFNIIYNYVDTADEILTVTYTLNHDIHMVMF